MFPQIRNYIFYYSILKEIYRWTILSGTPCIFLPVKLFKYKNNKTHKLFMIFFRSKLIDPLETNFIEEEPTPAIPFTSCPLLNISQCESSENQNSFVVTIYNPLSKPVSKIVRVPVTSSSFSVKDPTGKLQKLNT